LAEIFYAMISEFWEEGLQVVFVANGDYQPVFRDIVNRHGFHRRVAVCDFSEELEHQAYGAADFVLMPSLFEPCGLPQMIGCVYGALPVVHDTGGLHDTVKHLVPDRDEGNGFVFETYDSPGLLWAVREAIRFFRLRTPVRKQQIARIMHWAAKTFNHDVNARQYIELYEKMLQRPLIV
jgi:starch synthase/alpha-amylase